MADLSGVLPTPSFTPITAQSTVGEITGAWRADFQAHVHHDDRVSTTLGGYEAALRRLGDLASIRLTDLSVPQIHAWHRQLYATHGSAPAYASYATLRAVLGWVRRQGIVPYNVASGIGITHRQRPTRPLLPEQTVALREAIYTIELQRLTRIERLGLTGFDAVAAMSSVRALRLTDFSGRRPKEVCDILRANVDLSTGTITLPSTKTGPSVLILGADGIEFVRQQLAEVGQSSAYLFPSPNSPDRPVSRHTVWEVFHAAARHAGLTAVQLRGLRCSVAWAALFGGVDLKDTGRMLGHRSVKTTERAYSHSVYVTPGQMQAPATVERVRERARLERGTPRRGFLPLPASARQQLAREEGAP